MRTISEETESYIKKAEIRNDVEQGVNAAFERAKAKPITHGGGNKFWLITDPYTATESISETISLVDTPSVMNIAIGSNIPAGMDKPHSHPNMYNPELYPEQNKNAAMADAMNRWIGIYERKAGL